MSNREDYFSYLNDVLGIKSILLEGNSLMPVRVPLLIVVDRVHSYNAEENELLEKMIAALKIPVEKIKMVDSEMPNLPPADWTLVLADDPRPSQGTYISTYSPRVLQFRPEFKKKAWEEMQKLIGTVK